MLPAVREKIIASFTPEARDLFEREFRFFDKVTSISGVLFPLPKEERRAGIRRYFLLSDIVRPLIYLRFMYMYHNYLFTCIFLQILNFHIYPIQKIIFLIQSNLSL